MKHKWLKWGALWCSLCFVILFVYFIWKAERRRQWDRWRNMRREIIWQVVLSPSAYSSEGRASVKLGAWGSTWVCWRELWRPSSWSHALLHRRVCSSMELHWGAEWELKLGIRTWNMSYSASECSTVPITQPDLSSWKVLVRPCKIYSILSLHDVSSWFNWDYEFQIGCAFLSEFFDNSASFW